MDKKYKIVYVTPNFNIESDQILSIPDRYVENWMLNIHHNYTLGQTIYIGTEVMYMGLTSFIK